MLLEFLDEQRQNLEDLPANVANILKKNGYKLPPKAKVITDNKTTPKRPVIDTDLLEKLTANVSELPLEEVKIEEDEQQTPAEGSFLYLNDLHWLHDTLSALREKNLTKLFLYQLVDRCELLLPENEYKPRNPVLEARCQRLREEQQNRDYQKMTKNVDATLKHHPEDTVAYQRGCSVKFILYICNCLSLSPFYS